MQPPERHGGIDSEPSLWRALYLSDGVFGFFGCGERFDSMSKVALTCFGETDPTRRAMQKLHAEPRFKLADALAHCGF